MTAEDSRRIPVGGIQPGTDERADRLEFRRRSACLLRQDPTFISSAKSADFETAEIAVKGGAHRSTCAFHPAHTMRLPPSPLMTWVLTVLVATIVNLICAPALSCAASVPTAKRVDVPEQALIDAGYSPEEAKKRQDLPRQGLLNCNKADTKAEQVLYEVMEIIRQLANNSVGASALELKKKAIEQGMITLRRSGLIKVALVRPPWRSACAKRFCRKGARMPELR